MKLILIGSHLCQDTLYALNKLKDYKGGNLISGYFQQLSGIEAVFK